MAGIAVGRLINERNAWRKDHPFGFIAKSTKHLDGFFNLFNWECAIPGKKDTIWEGGPFKFRIVPNVVQRGLSLNRPKCKFEPPLFHPNVYPLEPFVFRFCTTTRTGSRPLPLNRFIGIQDLLNNPNVEDPAQAEAYQMFCQNRMEYERRIRREAAKFNFDMVQKQLLG